MSDRTIAVLGLGIIGSRAFTLLKDSGIGPVKAWNRTPKGIPGEASSIEEACFDADLIVLYLKDGAAVRAVTERIFALPPGNRTVVNHSTVDLETTRWLARECAERGIGFLDCPFTGSRDI